MMETVQQLVQEFAVMTTQEILVGGGGIVSAVVLFVIAEIRGS
jgi:hypothetical protein